VRPDWTPLHIEFQQSHLDQRCKVAADRVDRRAHLVVINMKEREKLRRKIFTKQISEQQKKTLKGGFVFEVFVGRIKFHDILHFCVYFFLPLPREKCQEENLND
jgi:hypothetical protein